MTFARDGLLCGQMPYKGHGFGSMVRLSLHMTVKRKYVQNFRDLRFTDVLEKGQQNLFSFVKKSVRATEKPW